MNGFKNSLGQVLWQAFDVICGNLICLILRITTITAILFLLSLARGDSSLSDCYITQILSGAPAPPIIQFTCLCSYYSVFPPNKIYIFLLFKDTIKTTSQRVSVICVSANWVISAQIHGSKVGKPLKKCPEWDICLLGREGGKTSRKGLPVA